MKKFILSLIMALSVALSFAVPVSADDKDNRGLNPNDVVLPGGYVSRFIGLDKLGHGIYQADLSAPQFLDDLTTRIDTQWYWDSTKKLYVSGDNKFTSQVDGETANVVDKQDNILAWTPSVSVDNFDANLDKSGIGKGLQQVQEKKPKLLAIDPINSNYKNNTLEWNYGHGVYRRLRLIEGMVLEYYVITKPIGGDFNITQNSLKSVNFNHDRQPSAYDSDHKPLEITFNDKHDISLKKDKSLDAKVKYPITIDPDMTFTTSASDGYLIGRDAVYNTAWTAASASFVYSNAPNAFVGQWFGASTYDVNRGCLYFDTSSLPDANVITVASLKLYSGIVSITQAFDIVVTNGMPTYPHDPMVSGDYDKSLYAGNGGSYSVGVASWALGTLITLNLNATGIGWIDKTSYTKYMLRSSRDISGTAPVGVGENMPFLTYEYGIGYRPQLLVTYTALSPSITVQAASNVAKTTARLNSTVVDDGGDDNVSVRFGYGTTSHTAADFLSYTTVTTLVEGYHIGDHPYYNASGLLPLTTYYYRAQVQNSVATMNSTSEISFITLNSISDVSNFYGIPSDTSNSLSWSIPSGASRVLVRYRSDTFPTGVADGNLVVLDSVSTKEHTGLTAGKTYYYSAWGESGGSYSSNATHLALTTLGVNPLGSPETAPDLPSGWFQTPSSAGLAHLEPIPTIISLFAGSWDMPTDNMWFLLYMVMVIGVAFVIFAKGKSVFAGTVWIAVSIIFGVAIHLIPSWMLLIPTCLALGTWALSRLKPVGA